MNENENTTTPNLWDTVKAVLQWADLSEKIEETEARIQEEAERNVSGS